MPELQKRGIMWKDYAVPQGTFRENLLGHPRLADDHYGAKFRYGRDPSLVSNISNKEAKVETPVAEHPKLNGEVTAVEVK